MASLSTTTPKLGGMQEATRNGFGQASAAQHAASPVAIDLKAIRRTVALKQIGVGLVLFAVGAGVTALSYSAASDGGTYLVMFGPIIGGGWMFLKGIWGLLSA